MSKTVSPHPKYSEMITAAIATLEERNGSSRQGICKYIKGNYPVGEQAETHVKTSLRKMVDNGDLLQTTGTGVSGSFKLNKAKLQAEKKLEKAQAKKSEDLKENDKPAAKKSLVLVAEKTDKKPAISIKRAATKVELEADTKKPATKKSKTESSRSDYEFSTDKKPAASVKLPAPKEADTEKPATKKPAANKAQPPRSQPKTGSDLESLVNKKPAAKKPVAKKVEADTKKSAGKTKPPQSQPKTESSCSDFEPTDKKPAAKKPASTKVEADTKKPATKKPAANKTKPPQSQPKTESSCFDLESLTDKKPAAKKPASTKVEADTKKPATKKPAAKKVKPPQSPPKTESPCSDRESLEGGCCQEHQANSNPAQDLDPPALILNL